MIKNNIQFQILDIVEYNENANKNNPLYDVMQINFKNNTKRQIRYTDKILDDDYLYKIKIIGKTFDNKNVYLKINNYEPYFYLLPYIIKNEKKIYKKILFTEDDKKNLSLIIKKLIKHINGFDLNKYFRGIEFETAKKFINFDLEEYIFIKVKFSNDYVMKQCLKKFTNRIILDTKTNTTINDFYVELYESNIPIFLKFIHELNIESSGWINVKNYKFSNDSVNCDINIEIDYDENISNNINFEKKSDIVSYKICSFDCECYSEDRKSFPNFNNKKDEIFQIGLVFDYHKNDENSKLGIKKILITLGKCDNIQDCIIYEELNEVNLLKKFAEIIKNENPDFVIGYNIFGFDEEYIYNRAKLHNIDFDVLLLSRFNDNYINYKNFSSSSSAMGENLLKIIDMPGRIQVDLIKIIQKEYKLSSYKLDSVSEYFIKGDILKIEYIDIVKNTFRYKLTINNINLLQNRNYIKISTSNEKQKYKIYKIEYNNNYIFIKSFNKINYDDNLKITWGMVKDDVKPQNIFNLYYNKISKDIAKIGKYCIQDCMLVLLLFKKLEIINNIVSLAKVCYVPINYIILRGQGIRSFSLIYKYCKNQNYKIPEIKYNPVKIDETYIEKKYGIYYDNKYIDEIEKYFSRHFIIFYNKINVKFDNNINVGQNINDENYMESLNKIGKTLYNNFIIKFRKTYIKEYNIEFSCEYDEKEFDFIINLHFYKYYDSYIKNNEKINEYIKNILLNISKIKIYNIVENFSNESYEGAIVFDPIPGFYKTPISVLDYNSLYPSSIIENNISHETIVDDENLKNSILCNNIPDKYNNYIFKKVEYINEKDEKVLCIFAKCKDKKGIIAEIECDLISERKQIKKMMDNCKDVFQYKIYDGLQLALKTIANSLYGQLGSTVSPIYNKELAACTTATGRIRLEFARDFIEKKFVNIANNYLNLQHNNLSNIDIKNNDFINTVIKSIPDIFHEFISKKQINIANNSDILDLFLKEQFNDIFNICEINNIKILSLNPKIIYGDTDSIFINYCFNVCSKKNIEHENANNKSTYNTIENKILLDISIKFSKLVSKLLFLILPEPQNMEYEKTFFPLLLYGKKYYTGNKYTFDTEKYDQINMGNVLKRRDNANIVKKIVGGLLDILLNEIDEEKAINFILNETNNLLNGYYPIEDFITTKTLKPIKNYKDPNKIAHVVLSLRVTKRNNGIEVYTSNDRIPYVYIYDLLMFNNKLQGDFIEIPSYVIDNNLKIDYLHYLTNQIKKPCIKILNFCINKNIFGNGNCDDIFDNFILNENEKRKNNLYIYAIYLDYFKKNKILLNKLFNINKHKNILNIVNKINFLEYIE